MMQSHSYHWEDYSTKWYKQWAKKLLQDDAHKENFDLHSNKFWQNAAIAQSFWERKVLRPESRILGFGVGQERLPALFASHGAYVTASDQDFKNKKAGHWKDHELASSSLSLNRLSICDSEKFREQVEFRSVNMKSIPVDLSTSYDGVWSNCALGHLGSIPEGIRFIEKSLDCLKPGGWAAHTTELNILSNDATVTDGDTVIFRLKDIHNLYIRLTEKGFKVQPFIFTLGNHPKDRRIALAPLFGNDNSKIQVRGHIATQILLLIEKPTRRSTGRVGILLRKKALERAYVKNLRVISSYAENDTHMKQLRESKAASVSDIVISPQKTTFNIEIQKGHYKDVKIAYKNDSKISLFGVHTDISPMPIVMASTTPMNRKSRFAGPDWVAQDRPTATVLAHDAKGRLTPTEWIAPHEDFTFSVRLHAGTLKKGHYIEDFSVVQELIGWIADTRVRIKVEIV